MTSRASTFGAVNYELESAWAEAVTTTATRLAVIGEPTVPSNIQDLIVQGITKQYANEGARGVRGPWNESGFSITLPLTGHGGTCAGSLTATPLYTLLLNFFGGGSVDMVGTTVDAAPTSGSQWANVGGTMESGNMCRVGVLGDGRGEGQFVPVDNISTITTLIALAATPAAADVVHAAQHIYPNESPSTLGTIASTRWLLQTSNGQWFAHGAFPTTATINAVNPGETPTITLSYGVSRWAEADAAFPDATATDGKDSSVVAAGTFAFADVGSVTRTEYAVRNWSLTIDQQVQPQRGPGGVDAYQVITGAVRTQSKATLSITADAEASGTNTLLDMFTQSALKQLVVTLNAVDGKALGFYFPNLRALNYPTQENTNGLNTRTLQFEALTGPTTTSDETMASWRLAMG